MWEVIELNEHQMGNLNYKLYEYLSQDSRDVTGLEIDEILNSGNDSYQIRYSYEYEDGQHPNGNTRWTLRKGWIDMKARIQPKILEDVNFY